MTPFAGVLTIYICNGINVYTKHFGRRSGKMKSMVKMTTIRLDMKLANEAVKSLGAKSMSEAVHIALR